MAVASLSLTRILLIVLLAMTAAGCELIGGIFKAGVWVGAIGVILVAVAVVWVVAKARG
jgi:hypothetical protein